MPDHATCIASIFIGYEIDCASLITDQIHKAALLRSSYIPFPCSIYRLYLESGVESLHHLDSLIAVQCTLDASLIKAKDIQLTLW